jgi:hypothetical protein
MSLFGSVSAGIAHPAKTKTTKGKEAKSPASNFPFRSIFLHPLFKGRNPVIHRKNTTSSLYRQ